MQTPLWLLLAIVCATFVLEDPATVATGVLLGKGDISWSFAWAALFVGIFLGDLGLYCFGRGIRQGLFEGKSWHHPPTNLSLVLARFVPGMRTLTFGAAGFFRVPVKKFILITFPSVVVWTFLLLQGTEFLVERFSFLPWGAWVGLGVAVMVLGQVVGHYVKKRASVLNGDTTPTEIP